MIPSFCKDSRRRFADTGNFLWASCGGIGFASNLCSGSGMHAARPLL